MSEEPRGRHRPRLRAALMLAFVLAFACVAGVAARAQSADDGVELVHSGGAAAPPSGNPDGLNSLRIA